MPDKPVVYKTGLRIIFQLCSSSGKWREHNGYKKKGIKLFTPAPLYVVCKEKPVERHTDQISLANHRLKFRHISREQRLKLRKPKKILKMFFSRQDKRRYYIRLTLHPSACLSVCLFVRPQYSSRLCDSQQVIKKTGQCI